jgi:poly-gamma-glutamate synthesis protein (capsule biosynthesis protein)
MKLVYRLVLLILIVGYVAHAAVTTSLANSTQKSTPTTKLNNEIKISAKPQPTPTEPTPEKKAMDQQIVLAFAGDILLDGSVKQAIKQKGVDYPFKFVKNSITSADFAVANLENPITYRTKKDTIQIYNFKADHNSINGVKNAGFDLVSLANNHALDYYEGGLLDTIGYLNKAKMPYIGAGKNSSEAFKSHTIIVKGKTIKFLAFSRFLPSSRWHATNKKPGVASAYNMKYVYETIKKEKAQSDILIVYMHWGKEKSSMPLDFQRPQSKAMIDAGADAIVSSHPHVLQGFEIYKGKPIAYSIGNFLFPDYVKGPSAQTGIYKLTIDSKNNITPSFEPFLIKGNQIIPISQKEKEGIWNYLKKISFRANVNKGIISGY